MRNGCLDLSPHLRLSSLATHTSTGPEEDRQATGHHCEAPRGLRKEEGGPRRGEEVFLTYAGAQFCLPTRDVDGEDDRGCGNMRGGNKG